MYNNCIEIVLVASLIVILYKMPDILADAINNRVGKCLFICLIIYVYKKVNANSAIILSIILIVIMRHNYTGIESFSNYSLEEEEKEEEGGKINKQDKPRVNNMIDLNRKIKLFAENNTVQSTKE
jgi:hypothetical protein